MPSAAAMAMARMIGGKHSTRSVKRISASSRPPAGIGRDCADQDAEQRAEQHDGDARKQRDAGAVKQAREHIAPERVGAEPVLG